jgi:hypothetical protein
VEANSTGGQGTRRAVAPSDGDDDKPFLLSIRIVDPNCIFLCWLRC